MDLFHYSRVLRHRFHEIELEIDLQRRTFFEGHRESRKNLRRWKLVKDEKLVASERNTARYFSENRHVAWVALVLTLLAALWFGSLGHGDFQNSGFEGCDLGGDFISIEGEKEISDGDVIPVFLMPGGENSGSDGFADGGDDDCNAHDGNGWELGDVFAYFSLTCSPKACAMSSACWSLWAAVVPTAVLALASRPA